MTCCPKPAELLFANGINMKYLMFWALLLALAGAFGCKKHEPTATAKANTPSDGAQSELTSSATDAQPPIRGPGSATATHAPVVIPENADTSAVLSKLSLELRRYVLRSQKAPKNFEEFVKASQVQAPPAPPGKKYQIERGAVVLVSR
jgi:hypothetical protein